MPETATIVFEAMVSYRELLKQVRNRVVEVDAREARAIDGAAWVDVREQDEWDEGHIPGAVHVPRGNLESRIEGVVGDRSRPVVLYCASGARSAFAVESLTALGYERPVTLAGGFIDWKRNGYEVVIPKQLSPERRARYSRHLLIPEIGEAGQLALLDAKILLLGAGGLGSPASLYLAAAGVGHIGIVDADIVDESNLQRQIAHSLNTLGSPKVDSARRTIEALNPDVEVTTYRERLTSENIDRILDDGWDIIVDGTDNFPTRYLVNDASVWRGIPVVHGSIYRFEGQVTVFKPGDGPCYRCLYPAPPPPELAPSCAEGGVLGVLPGIVGTLQTNEALKLAVGVGEPLVGRLLLFDALSTDFDEVRINRNPECPVCGEHPTITEYVDYVEFCSR
jgi:sulfur-carrier protein adenylyltransferase/sulfurtransferase